MTDSRVAQTEHWIRYYGVTAERPAWETVRFAIQRFAAEPAAEPRFAVDLGCGAGRDARELLKAGWRVLAVDREPAAMVALVALVTATAQDLRPRLATQVADLAEFEVPPCDLVNASLSLPFLASEAYWEAWRRIVAALPVGGRFAAMLFGDQDASASDVAMTCPPPAEIHARLTGFEIEHWINREEDSETALGEPHHFHRVEFVARRRTLG